MLQPGRAENNIFEKMAWWNYKRDWLQSVTWFYERSQWHIKSVINAFSVMPASGIVSVLKRQSSNVTKYSALTRKNALAVGPVIVRRNISARCGLLSKCNRLYAAKEVN
jgi:hypothetical protein